MTTLLRSFILAGTLSASALLVHGADLKASDRLKEFEFGKTQAGKAVAGFTLKNAHGLQATVITYGATVTELLVPDAKGEKANVILGSDQLDPYLRGFPAASVIGRFANRIAGASFSLDGETYELAANNGPNHIHGGREGFARKIWTGKALPPKSGSSSVELQYVSQNEEEGYPGKLTVTVRYTLNDRNEFKIEYGAETDEPTIVNLTNHAYFNLAGSGDTLDQILWIDAKLYTPADDQLIPTGEIRSVKGTPLDFTEPMAIGARIDQLKPRPGGYDHNYVLNKRPGELALIARAKDPKSGRQMETLTTEPGVQLYTGNHLTPKHAGFCLETQHFPDSIHQPHFPSVILRPDEKFESTTVFRFSN